MAKYAFLDIDLKDLKLLVAAEEARDIYMPVRADARSPYRLTLSSDLRSIVSSNRTILPPRKFIQPRRELHVTGPASAGQKLSGAKKSRKPKGVLLFGLSREDIDGLYHLDTFFAGPIRDESYSSKRKFISAIGVDNDLPRTAVVDIFILKDANNFKVIGDKDAVEKFVAPLKKKTKALSRMPEQKKRPNAGFGILNRSDLSEKILKSAGSRIWNDLEKRCFGCGICTYVCPVCYCFTTEDEFSLSAANAPGQKIGTRHICWDSCMLPDFTLVSGGHRYQSLLRQRIYNWFHHKFVRIPLEYPGLQGCVQCGRCIRSCPAKIDLREVLNEVVKL